MEIIDIRHFDARDFAPLLESESQAWLSTLRWDYTPSARLISSCLADKRLSGYALMDRGQIRGYSFFLYEGEKGLLGGLYVEPDTIRRENASLLLDHVIETLKNTPGVLRVEAQLPHFALEDIEPCFRRQQFDVYLRRFMTLRLSGRPLSGLPAVWNKHFAIEPWARKFDAEAARLLCRTYRLHVDSEINDQYRSVSGASHLIENIMHLRGCGEILPQASFAAIHRASGKLAGILALTAVRQTTAHIPQVAVDTEFQGRCAGAALMETGSREAERLGFEEITLTVTEANSGAVRFYERLGFETFQTFGAYVWKQSAGFSPGL